MKKITTALLITLAMCGLPLAQKPDKKKEDKNAPRKIEITGDPRIRGQRVEDRE